MARLKLIPLTPLSITVSAPVVSDTTIPATIPITIVVTAAATTGFSISSGFAYPFSHPYGPPHGYQGFIPPPELTQGFPTDPFGPYGPYGSHPLESPPLVSHPLTLKPIVSQVFVPQYYGANPYGAQLFVSMGNPGYTISHAVVVTYPLQEDLTDLYHGPSIHSDAAEDAVQGKIQALSKKLSALQGKDLFGKNAGEMCLVPNVRVPAKFKLPEFDKYKGSTCHQTHQVMYCRKMVAYIDNDKLLIHYFQDSLSGAPLRWYMSLERAKIQNFLDLDEAFVQHISIIWTWHHIILNRETCPKKSMNHLRNMHKGVGKLLPKSLHLLKKKNCANYS